jgi:A/G-specific adenine glycosylase
MLQQTPVGRVAPAWIEWMARWPDAPALAAAEGSAVVRQWGTLGYPRRALRLHEAARACVARHGGAVPCDETALLALPGVGSYTAAAVLAFAFGRRAGVVDINVARVVRRVREGTDDARPATAADRRALLAWLPADDTAAAASCAALMELGALVCTARAPGCGRCPLADGCLWRRSDAPGWTGPAPRRQTFAGTDRQVRGRLLAALRGADHPVDDATLASVWPHDGAQQQRALASLAADGLALRTGDGWVVGGARGAAATGGVGSAS